MGGYPLALPSFDRNPENIKVTVTVGRECNPFTVRRPYWRIVIRWIHSKLSGFTSLRINYIQITFIRKGNTFSIRGNGRITKP
jgi:hypothetical protein